MSKGFFPWRLVLGHGYSPKKAGKFAFMFQRLLRSSRQQDQPIRPAGEKETVGGRVSGHTFSRPPSTHGQPAPDKDETCRWSGRFDDCRRKDSLLSAISFTLGCLVQEPAWEPMSTIILAKLGETLNLSFCFIAETPSPREDIHPLHWYFWPGETGSLSAMDDLIALVHAQDTWRVQLASAGMLGIRAGEFPEPVAEALRRTGGVTAGLLLFPVRAGNDCWGIMGFGEKSGGPCWDDQELRIFHLLAGSFGAAIQRARLVAELEALSLSDELTGLHNRRGFMLLANQQLKLSIRAQKSLSLFFLDLDNLKGINDRWGHPYGDRALQDLTRVLRESFRDSDILARLGGDEFAALALDEPVDVSPGLMDRLHRKLIYFNMSKSAPYHLSASIGLARLDPANPCSMEELLSQADAMMYLKKRNRHKE